MANIVRYEKVETVYLDLADDRFVYDEDKEAYALTLDQAREIVGALEQEVSA